MKRVRVVVGVLIVTGLVGLVRSHSQAGMSVQGMSVQGMSVQGMSVQGMSVQGMSVQGMSVQGMSVQGMSVQGMSVQGMSVQGMSVQGMSVQGMSVQGMSVQGMSVQGMSVQGMSVQGMSVQGMQLRGIDRLRALGGALTFDRTVFAQAQVPPPGPSGLQGLQTGAAITYEPAPAARIAGVQLQRGPGNPTPGSYLHVPDLSGTVTDIAGTFWNLVFTDAAGGEANVITYVAAVEKDTTRNSSTSSANDDIYLYTVYFRAPATGQWTALCPLDGFGKPHAMAMPVDPRGWNDDTARKKFTFACTAGGVGAKCARNWGYKPWVTSPVNLSDYYEACLFAARADYCQNDQSFTRDGTLVDLFDSTSFNPTAGLPYAPLSKGVMLHEEYQISVERHVRDGLSGEDLMSLPEGVGDLMQSGLQSSRYADLDPGRACPLAPYIDRCDPVEPYACYRASNMRAQNYGAFISVNSPNHCGHNEVTPGDPLDPRCNECVNRVCKVDPTCCGDPGDTFYPRALAWDEDCIAIRNEVCRSAPGAELWPPGEAAPQPGQGQAVILRGAAGSFEAIVTEAGGTFVEGWACDPDFPGASSSIQISIGGELGAANTRLETATADQPLADGWREAVAAECGGAGRHGFRFRLTDVSPGQEIAVYGIDLNQPGAPFSLLRGGKKTIPDGGLLDNPRSAIWTGWVEPAVSGHYTFCRQQPGTSLVCDPVPAPVNPSGEDHYRIWVNGRYVAGNWVDTDPNEPGAFTLPPPDTAPSQYLLRGVRYPVRVEYERPAALPDASQIALLWSVDGGAPVLIAESSLHPMAQPDGNGLQGTFFSGVFDVENLPDNSQSGFPATIGAVDRIWTDVDPPVPGLSVEQSFGARFEGQVVPAISGDYFFTADTDGRVRITVNGTVVTDTSKGPPGLEPGSCSHDMCVAGAPLSKICRQGSFCPGTICQEDPSCCSRTWDARCVQQVKSRCGIDCNPTPPIAIPLVAGWRYDIKVEYVHAGGTDERPVRAAKLRLMWGLGETVRGAIGVQRLFTVRTPGLGVGLNATYFEDADFVGSYLDRVEPTLDFRGANRPTPARATGIVCPGAGGSVCGTADVLGAPALAASRMVQPAGGGAVTVELKGGGAARGATVRVFEILPVDQGGATVERGSVAVNAEAIDGGRFTLNVNLARGVRTLRANQSVGGVTSNPSADFFVDVTDPSAPVPPTVTQPAGKTVSGNGQVAVSGQAATGATVVTVTATPRIEGGTAVSTPFTVTNGSWGGSLTLPPGSYDLTFTQTVGGVTSAAGPSVSVEVAFPVLTLNAPAQNATFSCAPNPNRTCPVAISGTGAGPTLGAVTAGDGNGDFFVDLSPTLGNANGVFGGTVQLDYGRHVLKVFQRANGLDGAGMTRVVFVQPPLGALAITSPSPNGIVDDALTISGTGGLTRTGLPGTVIVYQGTSVLQEGPLDDDGNFAVPVKVNGAGLQTLSISQTASSLSGGGKAESARTSINVRVRPPAPVILLPVTGIPQPGSLDVNVSGTATPAGATVIAYVDGVARPQQPTVTAAGTFAMTLTGLTAGTHQLVVTATLNDAESAASKVVVLALGDITPPTVTVAERPIVRPAENETGAVVNFGTLVSATDAGMSLPFDCAPAHNPAPRFPIGSTTVTCEAVDAAGNRGGTTFIVTVTSGEGPLVTGTGLVAEATGPAGAAVNYQVSATGSTSDCAPPGSSEPRACTTWTPKYQRLGFGFEVMAQNTNPGADEGTLYLMVHGSEPPKDPGQPLAFVNSFFKLPVGATAWEKLTNPPTFDVAFDSNGGMAIGPGSPPVIYLPSDDHEPSRKGILVSPDGGHTWLTALPGIGIGGVVIDPLDPTGRHMLAWRAFPFFEQSSGPTVFETRDGWATWTRADQNLPPNVVASVAFDTVRPDRVYAALEPLPGPVRRANMFIRENGGNWRSIPVPPLTPNALRPIKVAPGVCGSSLYPAIFAGDLVSYTSGETWEDRGAAPPFLVYGPVAFDRNNPCSITSSKSDRYHRSLDGGLSWTPISAPISKFGELHLIQDVRNPTTFYSDNNILGPRVSFDGAQTWSQMPPTGMTIRMLVGDIAVDPVDPRILLLSAPSAVYRTTDGGDHWSPGQGINDLQQSEARQIRIDPLQRNRIYSGYKLTAFQGTGFGSQWSTSTNGALWTTLMNVASRPASGILALDPVVAGRWVSVNDPEDGSATLILRDHDASLGGASGELVLPVEAAPGSGTTVPLTDITPYRLQIVPDAARTVVLSWVRRQNPNVAVEGDVSVFSLRDAAKGPSPLLLEGGGLGINNVIYDGSDGTHRLFVNGGPIGRNPQLLYRTTVEQFRRGPAGAVQWEELTGNAEQNAGINSFQDLVIDPTSGGQHMFTLGTGLWESFDGGRTWQRDASAPPLFKIWLSPADGALYGLEAGNLKSRLQLPFEASSGRPWKREPNTGVPPGARISKGELRVTCTGPGPVDANGLPLRAASPGSTFPLGNTTLTCTATDVFGNVGSAPIVITVNDTTPPVLSLDALPTGTAPAGGTAVVTFVVTANDAVDGPRPVACTPASGAAFPIGVTTVTCSASDTRTPANTASISFPVVVSQNGQTLGAPVLFVPADATLEATDHNGASGASLVVTATTAGGNPLTPVCTPALASTFELGTTSVSCSATDPATMLTVTRNFNVTVRDTTAPTVTIPDDLTVEAQGTFGARVNYTAFATDAVDLDVSASCSPESGAIFAAGTTVVSCRSVDDAGNQAFARFSVTVTDQSLPILHLADMTVEAEAFTGGRAFYSARATDIFGAELPIDCVPPSGTLLPLGDTVVACTATGPNGREARGSFVVHVVDTAGPTVTILGPSVVEATGSTGAVVAFVATASDAVGGVVIPICRNITGFGVPTPVVSPGLFPIGDNLVTCTAEDQSGNVGSASLVIVVRDTTLPVLTLPAPITVAPDGTGTAAVTFTATAVDSVSGNLPVDCDPPSGSRFLLGVTTVTCVARDAAGNEARGTFTVTVNNPNTPPVVTVPPPPPIVREATSPSGAVVTFTVTATDAQDGPLVPTCTPASGSTFPIAVTTVTCTATDTGGLTGTATFTVTVRDTTGPILTVPPDITITSCTPNPNIGTATATDASPPVTITSNKPTNFPFGVTVVTYTARDAGNRTTTGTQRVTRLLGDDAACCPAGTKIIRGTSNNDTLNGTSGKDCILGFGGQDKINGLGDIDYISGGEGNDIIDGGPGNDLISGGGGQDTIVGGTGNDIASGMDGDDRVNGNDGDDTLRGGNGQDQLFGDNHNDQLFGEDGDDRLEGGAGNDALNGGNNNDTCLGGTGTNTVTQCSP